MDFQSIQSPGAAAALAFAGLEAGQTQKVMGEWAGGHGGEGGWTSETVAFQSGEQVRSGRHVLPLQPP